MMDEILKVLLSPIIVVLLLVISNIKANRRITRLERDFKEFRGQCIGLFKAIAGEDNDD